MTVLYMSVYEDLLSLILMTVLYMSVYEDLLS